MATSNSRYVRSALSYQKDVLTGRIAACGYVRLACQRQADDLKRWSKSGEFRFDDDAAHLFCAFAEGLPHVKGEWARRGETLKLEPWQCFVFAVKYGWLERKSGKRRFRRSYLEIARKNAKTTLAAAEALFLELEDGEPGAEVYFAAVDRKQASIGWGIAHQMVRKSSDLREHYGVEAMAHAIVARDSGSTCQPLSREAGSLEGLNVHGAVIDELHAHKTREIWDVIDSATGSRAQPLISAITTAGSDRSGICYEQRSYMVKVLEGAVKDERCFGLIYTLDEGDDWRDEASWSKANPNIGISVYRDDIRGAALKAIETPGAQANFLTKRMDVWVTAEHGIFDVLAWEKCGRVDLEIESYIGKPCYVGLDLAMKEDFCAMSTVFDVGDHIAVFVRLWLPEDTIAESKNSQYDGWRRSGAIEATDGDVVDFDALEDEIEQHCLKVRAQQVAYDPWSATQLAVHLQSRGVPMLEVAQTLRNHSEATKYLRDSMPRRLKHEGNPAMAWMMSNVTGRYDENDNVKPKRAYVDQKIDGPIAAVNALAAMLRDRTEPSVYSGRGLLTV